MATGLEGLRMIELLEKDDVILDRVYSKIEYIASILCSEDSNKVVKYATELEMNHSALRCIVYDPVYITAISEANRKNVITPYIKKSAEMRRMFSSPENASDVIHKLAKILNDDVSSGMTFKECKNSIEEPLKRLKAEKQERVKPTETYTEAVKKSKQEKTATESNNNLIEEDLRAVSNKYNGEKVLSDGSVSAEVAKVDEALAEINSVGTTDITFDRNELNACRAEAEKSGKIESLDESAAGDDNSEDDEAYDDEFIPDIEEVLTAVVMRVEGVFRSCLELDRPYGMLYDKGLLTYKVQDGTLRYIPGVGKGNSVFERLYSAIMLATGANLITAPDLRNVPNAENIGSKPWNYYPGYIFKYALGLVDDSRYTSWGKFKTGASKSIRKKMLALNKKELFYENQEKIERIFSTAILVLSYEAGAGIKLRVSMPGVTINLNSLESAIRSIMTYKSAGITITPVGGALDVVDVQVLTQESKFLDRPYWAYKAMQLKLDNNEKISLSDGLPIGRRVNGDIVEFKLDPSSRFLTFLAAGSGAGKGVLTLSLVAAALGSNVPVMYMDYKPDMAPIFWDVESEYGITTFAYDGLLKNRPNSTYSLGDSMPEEVKGALEKYSGAILYLKCVQLMCAMAQYRKDNGASQDIMFIFDETQAMQRQIKSAIERVVEIKKEHTPKKTKGETEEPDEVYKYTSVLLDWAKEINVNIDTYVNTTGRKSSTFCIFIAQSPDYSTWTNLGVKTDNGKIELLSRITFADTIFKILGRGSTTSKYGLGGDGKKNVSDKESKYVANNRFFGMYDGKTTDGAEITVFKPFLTLNSDNPMDRCWTNGMGKRFGYGSVDNAEYVKNIAMEHPGTGQYTNKYGIHTGTGLLGLTSMYLGGDMDKVTKSFGMGWEYCIDFFNKTGLINKYKTPHDYMYDMSLDGLMMIDNIVDYSADKENSVQYGFSGYSSTEQSGLDIEEGMDDSLDGSVNTGIRLDNIPVNGEDEASDNKEVALNASELHLLNDEAFDDSIFSDEYDESDDIDVSQFENVNNDTFTFEDGTNKVVKNNESGRVKIKVKAPSNDKVNSELEREIEIELQSINGSIENGADILDYIAYCIDKDYREKRLSKEAAIEIAKRYKLVDKGYMKDYSFKTPYKTKSKKQAGPVIVDRSNLEATGTDNRFGGYTKIDKTKTSNFSQLNNGNSVDCRWINARSIKGFQGPLMGTYVGADMYVKNMWRTILNGITDKGIISATVTRASMYGGQLYVNGKIVVLDGILSGDNSVRLRDIVNYKILFRKFPRISELRLDSEMLRVALMEFNGDPISSLFMTGRQLSIVYVRLENGKVQAYKREQADSNEAKRLSKEMNAANKIDAYCRNKSKKRWDEYTPTDKIWGMKLVKSSLKNSGKAMTSSNKKKFGKGVVTGALGLAAGAVGLTVWGGVNAVKGISRVGRNFRR